MLQEYTVLHLMINQQAIVHHTLKLNDSFNGTRENETYCEGYKLVHDNTIRQKQENMHKFLFIFILVIDCHVIVYLLFLKNPIFQSEHFQMIKTTIKQTIMNFLTPISKNVNGSQTVLRLSRS